MCALAPLADIATAPRFPQDMGFARELVSSDLAWPPFGRRVGCQGPGGGL